MCGISGFSRPTSEVRPCCTRCATSSHHRDRTTKPASGGSDAARGLAFGRRLSSLDLSPSVHQPMTSPRPLRIIFKNARSYNYSAAHRAVGGRGWPTRRGVVTRPLIFSPDSRPRAIRGRDPADLGMSPWRSGQGRGAEAGPHLLAGKCRCTYGLVCETAVVRLRLKTRGRTRFRER